MAISNYRVTGKRKGELKARAGETEVRDGEVRDGVRVGRLRISDVLDPVGQSIWIPELESQSMVLLGSCREECREELLPSGEHSGLS